MAGAGDAERGAWRLEHGPFKPNHLLLRRREAPSRRMATGQCSCPPFETRCSLLIRSSEAQRGPDQTRQERRNTYRHRHCEPPRHVGGLQVDSEALRRATYAVVNERCRVARQGAQAGKAKGKDENGDDRCRADKQQPWAKGLPVHGGAGRSATIAARVASRADAPSHTVGPWPCRPSTACSSWPALTSIPRHYHRPKTFGRGVRPSAAIYC